jgi:hypothetical protein
MRRVLVMGVGVGVVRELMMLVVVVVVVVVVQKLLLMQQLSVVWGVEQDAVHRCVVQSSAVCHWNVRWAMPAAVHAGVHLRCPTTRQAVVAVVVVRTLCRSVVQAVVLARCHSAVVVVPALCGTVAAAVHAVGVLHASCPTAPAAPRASMSGTFMSCGTHIVLCVGVRVRVGGVWARCVCVLGRGGAMGTMLCVHDACMCAR